MTRKKSSLTISASPETKEGLERLAVLFDCKWGDEPNISLLIERIANGSIPVGKQAKQAKARATIEQAKNALKRAIEELDNV